MRAYIQSAKARREENGDAGFSLIELIVVVVILGVLAAVAIPVFGSLQATAEDNARATVAANAASQYASKKAENSAYTFTAGDFSSLAGTKYTISIGTNAGLNNFCITAAETGKTSRTSGPGANAAGTGCS